LIGLLVPPLRWLYDYAWFVGFLVASLTYWISMRSRAGKTTVPQPAKLPEMTREQA
jgi:nucleobase:cation symporter-1, NCS1 family